MTYRARGAAPLVVRSLSILPALEAGVSLWPLGNPLVAIGVPVSIFVVGLVLSRVPSLRIVGDQVVVRRFFSSETMDRAGVSVRIVPGRVLHYKSWVLLLVVVDGRTQPFRWISWTRHDLTHPWSGSVLPPRATRLLAELEQSLAGDPRAGSGDDGLGQRAELTP